MSDIGLCCPKCGSREVRVTDSRSIYGNRKRRRRACRRCGHLIYTVEKIVADRQPKARATATGENVKF